MWILPKADDFIANLGRTITEGGQGFIDGARAVGTPRKDVRYRPFVDPRDATNRLSFLTRQDEWNSTPGAMNDPRLLMKENYYTDQEQLEAHLKRKIEGNDVYVRRQKNSNGDPAFLENDPFWKALSNNDPQRYVTEGKYDPSRAWKVYDDTYNDNRFYRRGVYAGMMAPTVAAIVGGIGIPGGILYALGERNGYNQYGAMMNALGVGQTMPDPMGLGDAPVTEDEMVSMLAQKGAMV